MNSIPFSKGLHRLTDRSYAWIVPDGAWGLSNAGLVISGDEALLVDTQYDLAMTAELREAVQHVVPGRKDPGRVVITHGNGDHFFGCSLFGEAEVIVCDNAARELEDLGPGKMALFQRISPFLGKAGRYYRRELGRFDFRGIPAPELGRVFSESLRLDVGGLEVQVKELGALHSKSDSVVWVPGEKVLFAGDLVFARGTPIIWEGNVDGLNAAYDWMAALKPEYIVPGHGPVCGVEALDAQRQYFGLVDAHARAMAQKGADLMQAARSFDPGEFRSLAHPERAVINLAAQYRHLVPGFKAPSSIKLFGMMEQLVEEGAYRG